MLHREAKRNGKAPGSALAPHQFGAPGGPDPVEFGSRGGRASGVARRLRPLTELERKVLESKNGAAAVKLLEIRERRDSDLAQARLQADDALREQMAAVDRQHATIDRLQEHIEELEADFNERHAAVAALERREVELRQRLDTDAGLDAWLTEIGSERMEASAERLGWFDEEASDASSVQPP